VISVTVIQQFQLKIMKNRSECDTERFNLLYNISISEVYWWDIVTCIYVSKAGSDVNAWGFFKLSK